MNRLPIETATAEQSRQLLRVNYCFDPQQTEGFTPMEIRDCASAAIITPALMDTCMRGLSGLEGYAESGYLPEPDVFFEEFPLEVNRIYQKAALETLANTEMRGAIARALIERERTVSEHSPVASLRRASAFSESKARRYYEYLEQAYSNSVIKDGALEASRTVGALIEVVPHLFVIEGYGNMLKGLRAKMLFRAGRSTLPIVNQWVRTTRENDANLLRVIERPSPTRDRTLPLDKYYGLRLDPSAFQLNAYRVTFDPDVMVQSHDRKSFGCPTNHHGHTGRLFRAILIAAIRSGAMEYVLEHSDDILSDARQIRTAQKAEVAA